MSASVWSIILADIFDAFACVKYLPLLSCLSFPTLYFSFRTCCPTTSVPFFSFPRVLQEAPAPSREQAKTKRRGSRCHLLTSWFSKRAGVFALQRWPTPEVASATFQLRTSATGNDVLLSCCVATQLGALVCENGPARCLKSTASSRLQL